MTVFVTTHYMDEAEHCDRLAMIYHGKLIAMGSPREMKTRHLHGTLVEIQADPLMTALEVLQSTPAAHDVAIFGANLHVTTGSPEAIPSLRAALETAGVQVRCIEPITPLLEDVFVGLVEAVDRASIP